MHATCDLFRARLFPASNGAVQAPHTVALPWHEADVPNPIPVEGRHLLQEIVILRCGCCNPYHSLARMIERREFPAAHKHELRPQPPVAIDPGADFMRIEPHQQPSAGPCRH